MSTVVITEFMDEEAVGTLSKKLDTHYDPKLVNAPRKIPPLLGEATALIVRNRTRVTAKLLEAAPNLRCVGRLGVGLDNIDLEACKERDVAVFPATGANNLAVAEYVIGNAMTLLRGAYLSTGAMLEGAWPRQKLMGRELSGKIMGLIGFGAIAYEVAVRAQLLGMPVVAFDPYRPANDPAWQLARNVSLEGVLDNADVISLHTPLTDATRHMIDAEAIGRMKKGAVLINAARGGVVDEAALAKALRSGKLGGAALDVFETEPLTAEAAEVFAGISNLVLTPHIAGVTEESNVRVSALIARAVADFLEERGLLITGHRSDVHRRVARLRNGPANASGDPTRAQASGESSSSSPPTFAMDGAEGSERVRFSWSCARGVPGTACGGRDDWWMEGHLGRYWSIWPGRRRPPMDEPTVLRPQEVERLVSGALERSNTSADNAASVARALLGAELTGQSGHGLRRVGSYAAQAACGKVDGHAVPELAERRPGAALVDAAHGFAYPALDLALDWLPPAAARQGIAIAGVTRSHHCGVAGAIVEALAEQGMAGLLFANTPAAMAPWGGRNAIYGTNPIAFAVPLPDGDPVTVDISLSRVARGKIMAARQKGDSIPEGWALDAEGQPTTDPEAALAGSMAPLGDAKGTVLALMVELLAAGLTGANYSYEQSSFLNAEGSPSGAGQTLIAIDPAAFGDGVIGRFGEMADMIAGMEGARVPGHRRQALKRDLLANGIAVDSALIAEIEAIGA